MMVREVYLRSAGVAVDFLARPAVAAAWEEPSALAKLRVGGVAAHLGWQIGQVPAVLNARVADDRVTVEEHFARSTWTDGDLHSEVNTYIRRTAEEAATVGPHRVAEAAGAALAQLGEMLPAEPPERVVQLPFGPWALLLDDYLVTRLVELAVHCDDLAASLGVDPPALPPEALDTVIGVLSRLAARRHGQAALIRALSRAERAPATIAAL
jgi:hypothetical protein